MFLGLGRLFSFSLHLIGFAGPKEDEPLASAARLGGDDDKPLAVVALGESEELRGGDNRVGQSAG